MADPVVPPPSTCEHGKTHGHPLWNGPFGSPLSQIVDSCPGPVVPLPEQHDREPDLIACRLSDLLGAVSDAMREYAVGGQFLTSHIADLHSKVDLLAQLLPIVAR